jgi:hypothetical protein
VFSVRPVSRLYKEGQLPLAEIESWDGSQKSRRLDVRWPPACEDVTPEADDRPLLEAATKPRSENRDWEH